MLTAADSRPIRSKATGTNGVWAITRKNEKVGTGFRWSFHRSLSLAARTAARVCKLLRAAIEQVGNRSPLQPRSQLLEISSHSSKSTPLSPKLTVILHE